MKFLKENLENHQVRITAEVDQEIFENYKRRAAKKISKKSKIAGFRPGKAPFEVVIRIYGEDYVQEQAVEILLDDIYPKLIKEADIIPSGPGKIEEIKRLNPPKIIFMIPLQPKVQLGDYQSIRKKYKLEAVTEEEINDVLHSLQIKHSTAESVDRAAEKGDLVDLQLNANLTKPINDSKSKILKDYPLEVIIGDKPKNEEPFPFENFDDELIGLKVNNQKKITHEYSRNSTFKKLQNKEVEYKIKIESIKSLNLPELNDDFSKTVSGLSSLPELKKNIKSQLESAKKQEYDQLYYSELFEKIISQSEIKYPPHILEDEANRVLSNFKRNLAQQNLDLETYMKIHDLKKDKFIEKEIKPAAKHQLEQALVIEEITKQEKIEPKKEELERAYTQTYQEMQATTNLKKLIRKSSKKRVADAILIKASSLLINQQVLIRLKEIATGEIKKINIKKPENVDKREKNETKKIKGEQNEH